MSGIKEIRNHIESIKDTQKITNAMYLIASTKIRKAKNELDHTKPYFNALQAEIKRIFRTVDNIESRYFYPGSEEQKLDGTYGYLVITADKGLAGAYNKNVIKEALRLMDEHSNAKLFVVGEYGRAYFTAHKIPIEKSFLYTAQNPTLDRAREISYTLLDQYLAGDLTKIYIIYTDFSGGMRTDACSTRLLPFHHTHFATPASEKHVSSPFEFSPSIEDVLDNLVPSYVTGFIYSALVDSFCSEQNARMEAMESAVGNAQKLLDKLSVEYNHMRQSAITQEITEISSGAKAQKLKSVRAKEAQKRNDR